MKGRAAAGCGGGRPTFGKQTLSKVGQEKERLRWGLWTRILILAMSFDDLGIS